MLESAAPNAPRPTWGQEVTVKMQGVLEDRTVVEKDPKLVFVIGEGDVNQVKSPRPPLLYQIGYQIISNVLQFKCERQQHQRDVQLRESK